MKKVLVVCTGNSCRSIIAEALINSFLDHVEAQSCGANPSNRVHPFAKQVLEEKGIWKDCYYSKDLKDMNLEQFDLVVSVCDNAKESCVVLPQVKKHLHCSFSDPDGKELAAFYQTYDAIKTKLLPAIQKELL